MFRVKICGITNVEDALAAVEAGADAIGLNFYERSPRFLATPVLDRITSALAGNAVQKVGVFVNRPSDLIAAAVLAGGLAAIQLHGDETPSDVAAAVQGRWSGSHAGVAVIRVRRLDGHGLEAVAEDLAACRAAGGCPAAVLVDSYRRGAYGGTGTPVPWGELAGYGRWLGDIPLVLAGGLTPDNVAEAIRMVRPAAVDVASGVEAEPGKKDPFMVRDFVAAARNELAEQGLL
ncbi:MAG: phosphoribosylanthranilate isomerase [Planctomycetota bacterium]|nr:MAG: phosphoribosylanthranilate isomerase [Planctomycetota bacterium]